MAKKKSKNKEVEYYKGVTYISIQSSQLPKKVFKYLEEFTMNLHKCRMLTYSSVQSGKPGGCPNGICH